MNVLCMYTINMCVSGWSLCSAGGGGAYPYGGGLPLSSHHHHGYPGRHAPYPSPYMPPRPHASGTFVCVCVYRRAINMHPYLY